jgi:hypothetical protein
MLGKVRALLWPAKERSSAPVPVLGFSEMEPASENVHAETGKVVDHIRLWRIRVVNSVPGTEAQGVKFRLEESVPRIQDIQVAFHETNDHLNLQERNILNRASVWMDTLARSTEAGNEALYAFRSDLPSGSSYIARLRPPIEKAISEALAGQSGLLVKVSAAGRPPAVRVDRWVRFFLAADGEFQAEFCDPPTSSL